MIRFSEMLLLMTTLKCQLMQPTQNNCDQNYFTILCSLNTIVQPKQGSLEIINRFNNINISIWKSAANELNKLINTGPQCAHQPSSVNLSDQSGFLSSDFHLLINYSNYQRHFQQSLPISEPNQFQFLTFTNKLRPSALKRQV